MHARTCLDLFTGLGCFSIAARACGVRTVAMCEIKSDCRHFLAANWPGVTIHDNAKTLDGTQYRGVWLVCGGPPCQPASLAGKRRGRADDRWLWPEAVRIVGQARPTWFLFENPPGIATVGLDGVLTDLEAQGYEVGEPLNIPACAIDAPHRRERLWLVGHRTGGGFAADRGAQRQSGHTDEPGKARNVANPASMPGPKHERESRERLRRGAGSHYTADNPCAMANGLRSELAQRQGDAGNVAGNEQPTAPGGIGGSLWRDHVWIECGDGKRRRSKPGVCGVVDGPSVGLLEALGNAIVWPIAARIIGAMIQAENI